MKNKFFWRLLLCLLVCPELFILGHTTFNNKKVNDFRLKNTDGTYVSLKDYPDAKGFIVVFTCNHCPFAKLYFQRLNDLNLKYKDLGVPVIAISSTDTVNFEEDAFPKMKEKASMEKINYPFLFDGAQLVAKNFSAQKTPHAFVIWKENGAWVVKYNGAIDDNGAEPLKVQHPYVANAVDNLLSGRDVDVKEVKSIGCQIAYRK
jgi:peroxiredoxin